MLVMATLRLCALVYCRLIAMRPSVRQVLPTLSHTKQNFVWPHSSAGQSKHVTLECKCQSDAAYFVDVSEIFLKHVFWKPRHLCQSQLREIEIFVMEMYHQVGRSMHLCLDLLNLSNYVQESRSTWHKVLVHYPILATQAFPSTWINWVPILGLQHP